MSAFEISILFLQLAIPALVYFFRRSVAGWIQLNFDIELEDFKQKFEAELVKLKQDFEGTMFFRERKDRFILTSFDKKLEAHQQAYRIIFNFMQNLFNDSAEVKQRLSDECLELILSKSLYMTSSARKALISALPAFRQHDSLVSTWRDGDKSLTQLIENNFQTIVNASQIIVRDVDLEAKADEWSFPSAEIDAFGQKIKNQ